MNLSLEKGDWMVQWDDGLIMPELKGGNTLALDLKVAHPRQYLRSKWQRCCGRQ